MSMAGATYKKVVKSSTNKRIVNEVCEFVEHAEDDFGMEWGSESYREALVETLEMLLTDMMEKGDIQQYKVVCDRRNNTCHDTNRGIFKMDIFFKAKNCLNTTQILYTITTDVFDLVLSEDDIIDFSI
jgi:hypothetical protein